MCSPYLSPTVDVPSVYLYSRGQKVHAVATSDMVHDGSLCSKILEDGFSSYLSNCAFTTYLHLLRTTSERRSESKCKTYPGGVSLRCRDRVDASMRFYSIGSSYIGKVVDPHLLLIRCSVCMSGMTDLSSLRYWTISRASQVTAVLSMA